MQKFLMSVFIITCLSGFSVKAEVFKNDIYDQNNACDISKDNYKTILKKEGEIIGKLYQCVDSKWVYQNDITNQIYLLKSRIYKNNALIMKYSSEIHEGSINLFSNRILNNRSNLYTKSFYNDEID